MSRNNKTRTCLAATTGVPQSNRTISSTSIASIFEVSELKHSAGGAFDPNNPAGVAMRKVCTDYFDKVREDQPAALKIRTIEQMITNVESKVSDAAEYKKTQDHKCEKELETNSKAEEKYNNDPKYLEAKELVKSARLIVSYMIRWLLSIGEDIFAVESKIIDNAIREFDTGNHHLPGIIAYQLWGSTKVDHIDFLASAKQSGRKKRRNAANLFAKVIGKSCHALSIYTHVDSRGKKVTTETALDIFLGACRAEVITPDELHMLIDKYVNVDEKTLLLLVNYVVNKTNNTDGNSNIGSYIAFLSVQKNGLDTLVSRLVTIIKLCGIVEGKAKAAIDRIASVKNGCLEGLDKNRKTLIKYANLGGYDCKSTWNILRQKIITAVEGIKPEIYGSVLGYLLTPIELQEFYNTTVTPQRRAVTANTLMSVMLVSGKYTPGTLQYIKDCANKKPNPEDKDDYCPLAGREWIMLDNFIHDISKNKLIPLVITQQDIIANTRNLQDIKQVPASAQSANDAWDDDESIPTYMSVVPIKKANHIAQPQHVKKNNNSKNNGHKQQKKPTPQSAAVVMINKNAFAVLEDDEE